MWEFIEFLIRVATEVVFTIKEESVKVDKICK